MSRLLQWLLGIGVLILVLAVAFAIVAPYVWPGAAAAGFPMMNSGAHAAMHARMYAGGQPGPMMGGRWGGILGGWGWFGLAGLFGPLALLGLLGLGVYLLVRRPTGVAALPASFTPAAVPPAAAATCAHCGQALQAGWKACPYCGEKV